MQTDIIHTLINLEAEIQVIGSVLLEPKLIDDIFVKEEYFYDNRHKKIMWLMKEMQDKGIEIEAFTLVTFAAEKNLVEDIGGLKYITESINVPTTKNLEYYQNIVLDLYKKREQVLLAKKILNSVQEENSLEIALNASNKMVELSLLGKKESKTKHIGDIMNNVYGTMISEDDGIKGSKSHFTQLDNIIGSFEKGDLVIIGARPSLGKTAFAMNIAQNHAAKNNAPAQVFSIEMPNESVGERIMASETLINSDKIKEANKKLTIEDWKKVAFAVGDMSQKKIYMNDESSVTIPYIRAEVKAMASKYEGEHLLVIIDYLQLIQGDKKHGGNRNAEVGEISRELKRIARETGCTMIALSQLSRGVESRQDKRPMMSDLRDSGSIEQD